jgi:hypothetical protein
VFFLCFAGAASFFFLQWSRGVYQILNVQYLEKVFVTDRQIEVEESMQNDKIWSKFGSTGSLDGHSYLDDLAEVEREDDRKRESVKKRKKVEEEEVEIKIRGLKVTLGWGKGLRRL